jgi:uncharacterized protein with HEPN domain
MQLDKRDLSYFIDMIECLRDIITFTENTTLADFEKDKMRKLAVERQLEVLGQAAGGISKVTQDMLDFLPWSRMIGLRNKLAHDYGEILVKRIWDISRNSIPELLVEISKVPQLQEFLNTADSEGSNHGL